MRLRMLKKDFSTQPAVFFFQLPYFYNLVIEKNINAQNKINLIKRLTFAYHVTHDVSVYAIDKRNGYYSLPVLKC